MGVLVPESTLVFTLGISGEKSRWFASCLDQIRIYPESFWGDKSYDATDVLASGAER